MATEGVDPFEQEHDMQRWAAEMGSEYVLGSQGAFGQPLAEMDITRLDALSGSIKREIREDDGLPAIPDDAELRLHVTREQLAAMPEGERLAWVIDSLEWSLDHPQARITHLFDD
ncbi:MAG: hypothetical protein KIH63_005925 [Candidatus Saccharibacteria bacterium]|nr:hypothetical protein [Candidatus Saccharibacteria bacterium]